jgi:hypothetical protein
MGVTRMSDLKRVKFNARYAAANRMTYAEISRQTGFPASTLRDWAGQREHLRGWSPTNTLWRQHLDILTQAKEQAVAE